MNCGFMISLSMNIIWIFSEFLYAWFDIFVILFELSVWFGQLDWFFLQWEKCLTLGSISRCRHPVTVGVARHYCIVAIEDKKMGFTSYCLSLFLYIMSSYLMRYSIIHILNTLDAGRNQLTCGVIVVDAESFRSTWHGRDAYIHDHCLRYLHNYALFYQLLGSNLFTHRNTCYLERSH